eukprot:TRINITY_DN1812_c0_g1_i1.p1 TRINITY_DN1812_c0_g1~~TRINITY_DN1812_c0_g1_i1.p1  ORF type:complete len:209 (-),score=25.64 TRINITY_DN1812_c0_g1_i1:990-1616(-)
MVASVATGLSLNQPCLQPSSLFAGEKQASSSCQTVAPAPSCCSVGDGQHAAARRHLLSFSASRSLTGPGLRRSVGSSGTSARSDAAAARAGLVQKVSAKELDGLLATKRTQPVVVDIYAAWCGPCVLLAPVLDKLAVKYGDAVKFLKLDADEEAELADEMEIRGLPTLIFYTPDSSDPVFRTEGLLTGKAISEILEKKLAVSVPVASA